MPKCSSQSYLLTVHFLLTFCLHLSCNPKGFAWLSMEGNSTPTICNSTSFMVYIVFTWQKEVVNIVQCIFNG